jgi:oligopeptide transport system substrate-binding protein
MPNHIKSSLLPTFLVSFILLIGIGCGLNSHSDKIKRDNSKDGLLVINQPSEFSILHPPQSFEVGARDLGKHMLETLVTYDANNKQLSPLLAESWTASEDHKTFTFNIRSNVFFHDDPCFKNGVGRELTAEDVAYCLKVICSKSAMNKNGWLFTEEVIGGKAFRDSVRDPSIDDLEGVQVLGGEKVQIKLKQANVEFVHKLSHYATSIYPVEAVNHYQSGINRNPVGSGPFKLKTFKTGQVCILERHSKYWAVDEQGNRLPYLAGVKIDLTRNARVLSNALQKELIHLVYNANELQNGILITEKFQTMQDIYERSSVNKMETVYLAFLNSEGLFSDPLLRKAFTSVIDVEAIDAKTLRGSFQAADHGLVPQGFAGYPYEDVPALNFDTLQARALLAQAGYPSGKNLPHITLQIQNRPIDLDVAEEIQRQLSAYLGVNITISALSRQEHFKRTEEKNASLWLDNWIADYLTPSNFLDLMLSINMPEEGGGYLNTYRYMNPNYDRLMKQGASMSDTKKRLGKYAAAENILIQKDAAVKPLLYKQNSCIQHKTVRGLDGFELGSYNLHKAYIETP